MHDFDAERGRRHLVRADRLQHAAEARSHRTGEEHDQRRAQAEYEIIVLHGRVETVGSDEKRWNADETGWTARDVGETDGKTVDEKPEGERRECQIEAPEPQRDDRQDEGAGNGQGDGGRDAKQRLDVVVDDEIGGGIAADGHEPSLSEIDLPGVTHRNVEADQRDEDDPRDDETAENGVGDAEQRQKSGERCERQKTRAPRHARSQPRDMFPDARFVAHVLSPCDARMKQAVRAEDENDEQQSEHDRIAEERGEIGLSPIA